MLTISILVDRLLIVEIVYTPGARHSSLSFKRLHSEEIRLSRPKPYTL